MKKTSALRWSRSRDKPDEKKGKHGLRRPRLHWLVLFLVLAGPVVCGQDLQVRPESKPVASQSRKQRALREQWFLRGRSSPGQSGAAQRYRAYLQKMRMRAVRLTNAQTGHDLSPSSTVVWSPLGPAPLASDASGTGEYDYGWVSGRATAVAVDPADRTGNTVYIGGAYGGVWKSTNAACGSFGNASCVAWVPLTDNQATLAIGAIAIQPGGTGVVLAGTGEANSSADSYYGLGILQSSNAGATWTLISSDTTGTRSFAGMGFSKIAFSSNSPNLVVAATAGTPKGIIEGLENPLTANLGLYYSADSGLSWTFANISDGGLTTAPGSASSVVYDASANSGAGQFFAALRYHGFYSSSDGVNWTRLTNQPGGGLSTTACPANPSSSTCPIYRGEIAVVPGRNEMYVWYVDANDFDQGIWTSLDGGNSWTQINDAGIINCGDEVGCGTEQGTYDLELAAVPNGGSGVTDLYAGAINLYKCEITGTYPMCNGTGSNTFLNLTHAYGCSAIAKVHPAQHAVSFLLTNNNQQDVMYFANDGGIYRALDGYGGLTTGTCGGSNQFDSLNMTMGSMTQFISFAQASGDASTILGGTQGNGSPGTQSTGGSWQNVNGGDGGFTQISPDNEEEWFVSNPPNATSGVNIFSCTNSNGISCHTQDFQSNPVVSSATVGGDTGPYYPPYILDPQNADEMIAGTCRLWRGSASGGAFTVLSHSFESGGDGICTGGEINLVRAVAAGGATDNNGFSNVIYSGTDGFGPLIPTTPPGGHVWVSTNVAGGLSTWVDQTGAINPNNFPISGIAMDTSDREGLTAYVSIMGFSTANFPTSHVWQTTNGGFSWTDFTSNLPDAPGNAVVVDPTTVGSPGRVYVATDVGVFWSFTASPNWQELGPPPNSGQAGYLPNVAVTALRIFTRSDSTKLLRASTYGRGVWEFPLTPDFSLSISNTPITIFAGQVPPLFTGTITALGGYNYPVNLSCVPASTCTIAPTQVVPAPPPQGTPLTATVIASNTPGDYNFDLHGVGTDQNQITNDAEFTLKVVDFNLTAPSPARITVGPGSTSGPVLFQVTGQGSFDGAVSLSCENLPAGATCSFVPAGPVNPTARNPVAVTLTVTAASNTTAGTFPVTINGSVTNGPTKTQGLSLTITLDYSLAISHSSLQAYVHSTVNFNGTLTSLNGYNSAVNLSCGKGGPPTCSAAPASVTPTASGAPFIVTVGSGVCGIYNFNIVAVGTDSLATTHTFPVTFTANSYTTPDYTLEVIPQSLTAAVNTQAIFNGNLRSTECYDSPVMLSCGSGAPPTCSTPTSVTPTVQGTPFTVTVATNDQCGKYNFNIVTQGTDPAKRTHALLVSFASASVSQASYSLTISNPTLTAPVNTLATFEGMLTASACYESSVYLSCGSNHPPTCTLPATATPNTAGKAFSVTVSSNVDRTYNFNIVGVGADPLQLQKQQPVAFASGPQPFNFTIVASPPNSLSVSAGQTASFSLDVTPSVGTGPFPRDAALSASNCPQVSTCTFSPTQVSKGSNGKTQITFTITTAAAVIANRRRFGRSIYVLWLLLPGLIVSFGGLRQSRTQRKRFVLFCVLAVMVAGLCLEIACGSGLQGNGSGGNGQAGTPPGSYTMTVSATVSGLPQQTAQVELTVN